MPVDIIQYSSITFNLLLYRYGADELYYASFAEADAHGAQCDTRFRYGSCADPRASRSGHGSGLGDSRGVSLRRCTIQFKHDGFVVMRFEYG